MRKLVDQFIAKQQAFAKSDIKKKYDEALSVLQQEEQKMEEALSDLVKKAATLYEKKEWEYEEHYGKPETYFTNWSFDFPNNQVTVYWRGRYGCDGYYDSGEFTLDLDFVLNENQEQEEYVAGIDAKIQQRFEERKEKANQEKMDQLLKLKKELGVE